jgi:hypothetical protein
MLVVVNAGVVHVGLAMKGCMEAEVKYGCPNDMICMFGSRNSADN